MDNNQVNVAIINQWFGGRVTGPAERFKRYAPGLARRGIQLSAFAGHETNLAYEETINGVSVHRFSLTTDWKHRNHEILLASLRHFRQSGKRPDVIQLLGHSIENALDILKARRFWGLPFLWVSTMMESPSINQNPAQRLKEWVYFQLLFQPLDCLVVSSHVMARAFTYYGAPHRRVVAIPNGVDLTRFRPVTPLDERSKLRYELGIDVDDQVLLFAGNICYRKGVDVLIAAWQQITQKHPKARLLLVGSRLDAANLEISPGFRNQDFIDQIDEAIRQSARPERVVFCGNVPDIERYMRAADIFVFPSRMEGMPNVIPEAMASGLATIMTPFDALPREFGRPGQEFMLVDRTAEDLASAVNTLLEDTNRLRTYAHAGREWMEKNMDIEISLDCYAELYRSLAQKQYPRKHGEW